MPVPSENRVLPAESHEQRRTVYSTCYMCACRCGIEVTLDGTELRFIQGNRNHPVNQGVLCAKGRRGHHEAALAGEARASRCAGGRAASAARACSTRSSGTRRSTS